MKDSCIFLKIFSAQEYFNVQVSYIDYQHLMLNNFGGEI